MSKKITYAGLNKFNLKMAALHFVQGVAMVAISNDKVIPVSKSFLRFDEATQSLVPATKHFFDVRLGWLIASFLFMSALAHIIIATVYRRGYEKNLKKGMNKARWLEYAVSASTMMVAIAALSGMFDFSSLMMLFALVAGMNLMGLVMEVYNQGRDKVNWLAYWVGCFLGFVPWIAYTVYILAAGAEGDGVPTFVYFILGSIFVFFNCFALNMWLQYKKIGPWKNYLFGEYVYIVLSLVAKSLLAWQVFAGTLQP